MEEKVKEFLYHNTTGSDESQHGSEIRNSVLPGAGLSLSNHDITLQSELLGHWQQLPEAETKPSMAPTFISFRGVGRGDDVDVSTVHHDLVGCIFHLEEKLHQHQEEMGIPTFHPSKKPLQHQLFEGELGAWDGEEEGGVSAPLPGVPEHDRCSATHLRCELLKGTNRRVKNGAENLTMGPLCRPGESKPNKNGH